MKKVTTAISVLLITFFSITAVAQEVGTLLLHAGVALPTGDFADEGNDYLEELFSPNMESGFAAPGFTIGATYLYPLNNRGLSLFGSLDLSMNNLSSDLREETEDDLDSDEDIKFSKYITFPINVGLAYETDINSNLSFIVKGGLGVSLLKLTDTYVSASSDYFDDEYENTFIFDLSKKMSFKGSAGFIIKDTYTLDLAVIQAKEHEIEWKVKVNDYGDKETEHPDDLEKNFSMVYLTFGMKLNALLK